MRPPSQSCRFAVLALAIGVGGLCAAAASRAAATDARWRVLAQPSEVSRFSVCDPVRHRMFMFGESYVSTGLSIWSASLDSTEEWRRSPTTEAPPLDVLGTGWAGVGSAWFDARRGRLVMSAGGGRALDPVTDRWTSFSITGSYFHSGAGQVYDQAAERVLGFGGFEFTSMGDPLAYNDLGSQDWSGSGGGGALHPSGTPPTPRGDVAMAYDSRRNRVMMFGGLRVKMPVAPVSYAPLDETWELTLGDTLRWRFLPPAGSLPPARAGAYAFYDSLGDRMLIVGGGDGAGGSFGTDLWSLDLSAADSARWTHVGSTPPDTRFPTSAAFDPIDRTIVFGGGSTLVTAGGTTTIALGARSRLTVDGTPRWSTQVPDRTAPYDAGLAALDTARDRIVVQLPWDVDKTSLWTAALREPLRWEHVTVNGGRRYSASCIVDSLHDRLLLFGGTVSGVLQNSVTAFPLTGGTAVTLATVGTPPAPRLGHCAVYDLAGDRMLVYGGTGVGDHRPLYDDVWALSLSDPPTWARLDPAGTRPPGRSDGFAMVDRNTNELLVLGGVDTLNPALPQGSGNLQDIWAFSLDSLVWRPLAPGGQAPYLYSGTHPRMDFDEARQRVYVVKDIEYPSDRTEVWALSLRGAPTWSRLSTVGSSPFQGATGSAFFDRAQDRLALAGGPETAYRVWTLDIPDMNQSASVAVDSAVVDSTGAHLAWTVTAFAGSVTVERNVDQSRWTDVATRTPDGAGRVRYDDATVAPGHAYAYRLRLVDNGLTEELGLVTLAFPARVTVFSAKADTAGVHVLWRTATGVSDFTVQRSIDQRAWSDVATRSPDPLGYVGYDDASVAPGHTYGYRLRFIDNGAPVEMGATSVALSTLVTVVSATADTLGVHLVWALVSAVRQVTLERHTGTGDWTDVALIAVDGTGHVRYDDTAVAVGGTYSYRLYFIENGAPVETGLTTVTVPLPAQILAFVVAPNPAGAVPRFVVALPADVPEARVELFDLGGRRVCAQRVVNDGTRFTLDLAAGGALRPGVYQARLVAGGRVLASRRLAVVR